MWYAKIFRSVFTSSLMEEDVVTRYIFFCFCVAADEDGVVLGSRTGLARLFAVSVEDFDRAVARLTSPDPNSTSDAEEGRRIVRKGPNVWLVVNYVKYRGLRSREDERAKARERMRRLREQNEQNEHREQNEQSEHVRPVRNVRNVRQEEEEEEEYIPPPIVPPQRVGTSPRRKSVSATPPAKTAEEPLLVFPCEGPVKEWGLTRSYLSELADAYPSLDVLAEAKKALAWVNAAPDRRKTASGMKRFLVNWLNRAVNSRRTSAESKKAYHPMLPPMSGSDTDEEAV